MKRYVRLFQESDSGFNEDEHEIVDSLSGNNVHINGEHYGHVNDIPDNVIASLPEKLQKIVHALASDNGVGVSIGLKNGKYDAILVDEMGKPLI